MIPSRPVALAGAGDRRPGGRFATPAPLPLVAAVDLLGILAGCGWVFEEAGVGSLAVALEDLGGAIRAAVAYGRDGSGRWAPIAGVPAGPSAAIGSALEPRLCEVAADGRSRVWAVTEDTASGAGLGDASVEWFVLIPVTGAAGNGGVLALALAKSDVDSGSPGFAGVLGALADQHLALGRAQARIDILEAVLHHQATHDPLTGLPNQVEFGARLSEAITRAERDRGMLAVAFLDLDRFRTVNDVLGHGAGDKLLQQLAGRLADRLGQDNVFRMAGDEFVLLRQGVSQEEDPARCFEDAQAVLKRRFFCDGHELVLSGSIGIALYPYDGEDVGTLVRNADCAMFRAKEQGGDRVECYSQGLFEQARRRLTLERSLHRAVESDELFLEFQPQFHLLTGEVTGLEALARWHHPELGVLLPGAFIPLAEETGLVVPIGERIMEMACQQAAEWAATGTAVPVWVNLSARQFHQCDLPALTSRCLDAAGLPPALLGVEVTESIAMRYPAEAAAVLGRLADLGVKSALDDFGTGYSSLAYLSRFSIDVLKLDASFVQSAPIDRNDATIARAVIALAHGLGITVVAEGVETEQQRLFLVEEGCAQAQGFLLARPMGPGPVARFLAPRAPLRAP